MILNILIKVNIIFFVILLTLSSKINSQTFAGFGFKLGLASAYNSETEKNNGRNFTTNSRFGFTAGLFSEFFKLKNFNLTTEIDFEQKGGNDKVNYSNDENNYSTLNLLSVPILAKITFPINIIRPYISFGPRVDILLSKTDGLVSEFYKHINPVNFGISVAAGTEIGISKKNSIIVEATYSPDISTYIYNSTGILYTSVIRNFAFEFRTGIKFNH